MEETQVDNVKHPAHYQKNGVECIDMIKAIVADVPPGEAYMLGNVVKYLWRYRSKNGLEDLKKARQYVDFLIEAYSNSFAGAKEMLLGKLEKASNSNF